MGKGLTQQGGNRETPEERSLRLKGETIKTIERLWNWAQAGNVFGSIVLKVSFENGIAKRLHVTPTEIKN